VLLPGWKTPYDIGVDTVKGVVWRANTGVARYSYKGRERFVQFGINGIPDIIGIARGGMFIGCEAKAGTNVSEMQKWFHLIVLKLGGYVFVARSYEDCDRWLREAGL
jgi:hypothetical protein